MSLLLWATTWTCAFGAFPVRSVDFTVDVDGPLAEVLVEQTFVNDADVPIEAVYVFPLHEEAAVDAMRIVIDGRVIEGAILEKHAASADCVANRSLGSSVDEVPEDIVSGDGGWRRGIHDAQIGRGSDLQSSQEGFAKEPTRHLRVGVKETPVSREARGRTPAAGALREIKG